MISLMPTPEEHSWLIDELARLGRRSGWEPLVCAPLLLPEPRFFPDPWTKDAAGLRRLARRLQRYAERGRVGGARGGGLCP